ncbi:hypothetical protein GGR50DRAFT_696101 [Xylaria sp. CBS 124048]|nr:hypothetical protein GGR50DRAFT_696101 [Xylaria sp. CBS 124048]
MECVIGDARGIVSEAVVLEAINNVFISHAYVLSCSPKQTYSFLPHKKVTMLYVTNFVTPSREAALLLRSVRCCIWSLGRKTFRLDVEATIAVANFLLEITREHVPRFERLRFVYCSRKGAEWDSDKRLAFYPIQRHINGEIEKGLWEIMEANPLRFDVIVARPYGIIKGSSRIKRLLGKLGGPMTLDRLAHCLVLLCDPLIAPSHGKKTFFTADLLEL